MDCTKDYYAVFGLKLGATRDEIKVVHRQAVLAAHPDKPENRTAECEARIGEINEAWAVLGDEQQKAQYDASRLKVVLAALYERMPKKRVRLTTPTAGELLFGAATEAIASAATYAIVDRLSKRK